MAQIQLIVGPVGAGKSTFGLQLSHDHAAVRLTLDDWMTRLFSPDRPAEGVMDWYVERCERCVDQIWRVAASLIAANTNVVLEIGLIRRHERERTYWRAETENIDLVVHVVDAPRALRRERVLARNSERGETFSMTVPEPIFELASDMWEPVADAECNGRDVHFVSAAQGLKPTETP